MSEEIIIELPKIGTGTMEDPYRPDFTGSDYKKRLWGVVEDKETTIIIRIRN